MEESTHEEAGSWQPQVRWWSCGWVVLALAAMAMLGFVIGRFAMRPEAAQTADKRQGLGIVQEAPIQKTPSGPPSPEVAPEPTAGMQAPAQQQPPKRKKTRLSKGMRQPAVTAQQSHQHVPASPSPVEHQREAIRTSP
jgi:hypothetical protein